MIIKNDSPSVDVLQSHGIGRAVHGVPDVHDLRAEYVGPDQVHAGMHIVVRRGVSIEEAERIAAEVNQQVHQGLNAGYCVIQIDAAELAAPMLARA